MQNAERLVTPNFSAPDVMNRFSLSGADVLNSLLADKTLRNDTVKRRNYTNSFWRRLSRVEHQLPSSDQMEHFQRISASSMSFPGDLYSRVYQNEGIAYGDFDFGTNVEAFCVVVSDYCYSQHIADSKVRELLTHELDHAVVFWKYGIPVHFYMHIAKNTTCGSSLHNLAVSPQFPENMLLSEKEKIAKEAVEHPHTLSKYDVLSLQAFGKNGLGAKYDNSGITGRSRVQYTI